MKARPGNDERGQTVAQAMAGIGAEDYLVILLTGEPCEHGNRDTELYTNFTTAEVKNVLLEITATLHGAELGIEEGS